MTSYDNLNDDKVTDDRWDKLNITLKRSAQFAGKYSVQRLLIRSIAHVSVEMLHTEKRKGRKLTKLNSIPSKETYRSFGNIYPSKKQRQSME